MPISRLLPLLTFTSDMLLNTPARDHWHRNLALPAFGFIDIMSNSPLSTPRGSNAQLPSSNTKNPVFSRIYKILGTNYNDHATRDALHTLSEIYAVSSSQASLSSSAKGALDPHKYEENSEEESAEGLEQRNPKNAVVATSSSTASLTLGLYSDATSRARRDLKRDMETRLMLSSQKFLQAFADVDKV
jgi:conserved oligomeric Golgi complex subunit 6